MATLIKIDDGEVSLDGENLEIRWRDGRVQRFNAAQLRAQCPCAGCRNAKFEITARMFPGLTVDGIQQVGSYALQFEFSDEHKNGAFPIDMLLEMPDEL